MVGNRGIKVGGGFLAAWKSVAKKTKVISAQISSRQESDMSEFPSCNKANDGAHAGVLNKG